MVKAFALVPDSKESKADIELAEFGLSTWKRGHAAARMRPTHAYVDKIRTPETAGADG